MTQTTNNPQLHLLTVSEAAACLRISKSLLYELIEAGRIAACRLGRGRGAIRIRMEDLISFVEQSRIGAEERANHKERQLLRLKHLHL